MCNEYLRTPNSVNLSESASSTFYIPYKRNIKVHFVKINSKKVLDLVYFDLYISENLEPNLNKS